MPELLRVLAYYSCNKWNWIRYDERDHFGQPQKPPTERLREDAEGNGARPAKLARQAAGTASKGGLAP